MNFLSGNGNKTQNRIRDVGDKFLERLFFERFILNQYCFLEIKSKSFFQLFFFIFRIFVFIRRDQLPVSFSPTLHNHITVYIGTLSHLSSLHPLPDFGLLLIVFSTIIGIISARSNRLSLSFFLHFPVIKG